MNFDTALGFLGTITKAIGAATAIGSAYVALGGPLPATIAYVDAKIATVIASVGDVKVTILEGQLRDIGSQRALLRNERGAIARTVERAPEATRLVLARRLGDIDDALARLTREEESVAAKLAEGKK